MFGTRNIILTELSSQTGLEANGCAFLRVSLDGNMSLHGYHNNVVLFILILMVFTKKVKCK